MGSQEKICGLCLKICNDFQSMEGDIKHIFDVVLPKTISVENRNNINDSDAVQELVMCTHCTETLIKCFEFKAKCLFNTYNYIIPFVNNKGDVKLNLKEIYLSKNENGTGVMEDEVICGLCMGPVKNCSVISLKVEERGAMLEEMIKQCLPELDLSIVEKPVVCAPCHGSLENCFHFVANCLLIEEKINKYCETLDKNNRGQVELSSLLPFKIRAVTTSEVNDNSVDIMKTEKQFCEEIENADERKIDNGRDLFKLEQIVCADSENASERESSNLDGIEIEETFFGENEICLKEENFFEMEAQKCLVEEEIEIKTDEHDFNRTENIILDFHESKENIKTNLNGKEDSDSSCPSSKLNNECILGLASTCHTNSFNPGRYLIQIRRTQQRGDYYKREYQNALKTSIRRKKKILILTRILRELQERHPTLN